MTDDKQKPDGWVACHRVEGFALITASRSRQQAEDRLLEKVFNFSFPHRFTCADKYYLHRDIELRRSENDGWRLRPVKLAFLDEDK